jgi:cytosine/creatinine deaminase
MLDLLLRRCRLPDGDGPVDLGIAKGRIVGAVAAPVPARETVDVKGRLVMPGLVESHIHLDKALLLERAGTASTLADAIRIMGDIKRGFTVEDVQSRARRVLDVAIAQGTTAMRSHVEVDPIVGLTGMEAVLPLKAEYAAAIDLQICAFAQEGIVRVPGTEALLRRALGMGADLVGGCPYNDSDGVAQIDIVFRLADTFGCDVDFHADFSDEPDHLHIHEIVRQTRARGWQGRVTVGHLTELAALPGWDQDAIVADIASAGIGVVCLPATDLYLMGRGDVANVRRGLTPVRRLLARGVPVALASNNIRNPFTPVGTADLAHMTFLAAVAAHMGTPDDLRQLVRMVTDHPAALLRLPDYGLDAGSRADLVVWDCERVEDIVTALPTRVLVVKNGRVTVTCERRVEERWREARAIL